MKLFLIGTLLFSGGTAAAMQNDTVRENVSGMYNHVRERVANRAKERSIDKLREEGFPYPSDERLANLTEEQQFAIISAIDQINATYDFSLMSDEEIKETLRIIHQEMEVLADELGIDIPDNFIRNRFRQRVNRRTHEIITEKLLEDLRTNGIEYPSDERLSNLTEEQQSVLLAKIDEFNVAYDWASMTDEEIMDALIIVKDELKALAEEYDFPVPTRRHSNNEEVLPEDNTVVEGTDEV